MSIVLMMRSDLSNLLKQDFPLHFQLNRNVIVLYRDYCNDFGIGDSCACGQCKSPEATTCDKFILKINPNGHTVRVIDIESFLGQFNGTKAVQGCKRCDNIAYDTDNDAIVFVEFTCKSVLRDKDVKIIIKKRKNAYNQIQSTYNKLTEVGSIQNCICSFKKKIGLFAKRERYSSCGCNDLSCKALSEFLLMSSVAERESVDYNMDNGVIFKEISYSDVFLWP